ncbi:hypothetical protein RHSIM_Rhsim11G0055200 [Rhododendron simsii]|uniref:Ubiquitin-like domain-containing protein n=1 Tax=Rhododendron simsii TaxID=118357 RepID=A0A834G7N5_RHOSS|nr:hypothetical protein RHSIM_Rhsim11G0055200 [Rhododendron simsii]
MEWPAGEPKKERTHVTLKVQREKMIDIYLRVRLELPLRKLKLAYCDRVGLDCDEVRFTYDGTRIGDNKTAGDLEMEDGDVIDAWSDQLGGAAASASCGEGISNTSTGKSQNAMYIYRQFGELNSRHLGIFNNQNRTDYLQAKLTFHLLPAALLQFGIFGPESEFLSSTSHDCPSLSLTVSNGGEIFTFFPTSFSIFVKYSNLLSVSTPLLLPKTILRCNFDRED